MTMVKAIIMGAGGRMGRAVMEMILSSRGVELVGAIEHKGHPLLGRDVRELVGTGRGGVLIEDTLEKVIAQGEVIIDFTTPAALRGYLPLAVKRRVPLVIGTTGFSEGELTEIRKAAGTLPILLSPNMSVGVNVMFRVVEETARLLGTDYDWEIIEAHHKGKKDAPSGTAQRLAQLLASVAGRRPDEIVRHSRYGAGARSQGEIGIHAVRAGDIVGEHTVIFGGMGERIEIAHKAHSRETFARGALRAAEWIVAQPPGLYDMLDLLGLRGGPSCHG